MEVDDYGLVVRAKFMAKPGTQFLIRRKAYVAVQSIFEENGIELAQPVVTVTVTGDEEGGEDDAHKRAAAAAGASAVAQATPAAAKAADVL